MADTTTQDNASSQYFQPRNTDELWDLVTAPHPGVGKAHHLGEALINAGMIQPVDLMQSLKAQQGERDRGRQRPIGQIFVELGLVSQDQLRQAIAAWLGEYVVHPGHLQPDPVAVALVPRSVAERESVLPLLARDDALVVLMILIIPLLPFGPMAEIELQRRSEEFVEHEMVWLKGYLRECRELISDAIDGELVTYEEWLDEANVAMNRQYGSDAPWSPTIWEKP